MSCLHYFNPRPRKEGDLNAPDNCIVLIDISIHALVKRATKLQHSTNVSKSISIHALVKRATLNKKVDNLIQLISIHALVKRATTAS